ncbi:outer membrane protein assembly factor BamB [Moraxella osloensis]|nr:outer membrane protein assembly factor BamB [Moraxella osloensis]MBW4009437.1 outer membrane protein assembly factor BamB [Moraxella osloensis]
MKPAVFATALVVAMTLTGCDKFKKSDNVHKPAALVKLASSQNVISPLFSQGSNTKVSQRFGNLRNKTTISQQPTAFRVAYDNNGYVNALADGSVQAFDGQGKALWSTKLKQGLMSGVALDEQSRVAVVSDSKGVIIALDRMTGKVIWKTPLDTATLSPALISQNRVITLGNDGKISALSLESGAPIWNFNTQNPNLSVRGSATPILFNRNTVLVSTADGRIHALNIDNGVPIWSKRFGISKGSSDIEKISDVDATPVLDGNMLYVVSYSGQLVAADMASQQLSFVKELASLKSVGTDTSQVYATSLDGELVAMDKMTGTVNWQTDNLSYRGLSNAVSIGNYVVVGDAMGYLHVYDRPSGALVDRKQAKSDVAVLQFINNRLIAQSANGAFSVWQVNR